MKISWVLLNKRPSNQAVQQIETILVCPMWAANFEVEGNNGNSYLVQFHRAEPASCTCPAYKYSGEYGQQTCKHIERVAEYGCFYHGEADWEAWNEFNFDENGVELLNYTKSTTDQPCPGCGLPLIQVRLAT